MPSVCVALVALLFTTAAALTRPLAQRFDSRDSDPERLSETLKELIDGLAAVEGRAVSSNEELKKVQQEQERLKSLASLCRTSCRRSSGPCPRRRGSRLSWPWRASWSG